MEEDQPIQNPSSEIPVSSSLPQPKFHHKLAWPIIIAWALILIVLGLGVTSLVLNKSKTTKTACTLEAKICPDGTSVGRTGANCSFAPCPVAKNPSPTPDPTASWSTQTVGTISFKLPSEIKASPAFKTDTHVNFEDEDFSHPLNRITVDTQGTDACPNAAACFQTTLESAKGAQEAYPKATYTTISSRILNQQIDGVASYTPPQTGPATNLPGYTDLSYYIQNGNNVTLVIFTINGDLNELKTEQKTIDQILSTFKFTDQNQTDTSNWKTYINPDLGITFMYPNKYLSDLDDGSEKTWGKRSPTSYIFPCPTLNLNDCKTPHGEFQIALLDNSTDKTLADWIKNSPNSTFGSSRPALCFLKDPRATITNTTTDGYQSITYKYFYDQQTSHNYCNDQAMGSDTVWQVNLVKRGSEIFQITEASAPQDFSEMQQILSTFKFIN